MGTFKKKQQLTVSLASWYTTVDYMPSHPNNVHSFICGNRKSTKILILIELKQVPVVIPGILKYSITSGPSN